MRNFIFKKAENLITKFSAFQIKESSGKFDTNLITNYNIGDYVILKDNVNSRPALWHNQYGIIKNIGYLKTDNLRKKLYLIHMSILTEDIIDFIDHTDSLDNIQNDIIAVSTYKKEKYDLWVSPDYIIKYDTKEEFDESVDRIEMEKDTKKYNI